MNPVQNPYAPGAGTPPPELAGRDGLLEQVRVALERIKIRRSAKSMLLVGLRGVGKTVLLDRMLNEATVSDYLTLRIEAPEDRSLPGLLAPELRLCLLKLSKLEKSRDLAIRGLRGLAGFVDAMKLRFGDIEVGLDFEPEAGLADNGDLEHDLQAIFELAGQAAEASNTAVAIFIDELQYVAEAELAALITALHRIAQKQLPLVMIGAGLPQLRGQMGNAKSYAERLFDFPEVGPLAPSDASEAIVKPADELDVNYDPTALNSIVERTQGYPYFLQEWGKHSWNIAEQSPITEVDVNEATDLAIAALDESFFRVRYDRLTPSERRYLYAMSTLGAGPHRSGDIADKLQRSVQSLGPTRSNLIRKGMVWSPAHGDTAFTVPLFDEFMLRTMPEDALDERK